MGKQNGRRGAIKKRSSFIRDSAFNNNLEQRFITLDVKQEIHDVAVVHDIFFPFSPHLPGFLRSLLALERDEVIEGNGLRAE